ncbi:hypothetical protein BBJ28_00004103 [Nothophytophthora sp. Chile5]|nr:hypothetical protein BBJ28_00004103 [Nothophytophthora sp. Chile5]
MEKRSTPQSSTRLLPRGGSSALLASSSSRLPLGPAGKDGLEDRNQQVGDGDAVAAPLPPAFDALKLLGPSLSEVLTLERPPQPRRLQQETQQDAGEATRGGGEDNQSNYSSRSSLADVKSAAKFDVCLSRSVVLGKLADPSVDNARKTQEYFAKLLSNIHCDATGLVLLQEATVVLFLETTAEQFVTLLKQLLQQHIIEAKSMKILASCDDNGVRILQGLYFKKVVISRNEDGEWTDDSMRQCAVDTFLSLVMFVKKIGPMQPIEIRKCLTNLSNTDQTFLPTNDLVLWLLGRDELMTIDEFLDFFATPVAIGLESERVWPVNPLFQY